MSEAITRELKYYRQAYERVLGEQAKALAECSRLSKERDEALRWKPTALQAANECAAKDAMYREMEEKHVAAVREAICERDEEWEADHESYRQHLRQVHGAQVREYRDQADRAERAYNETVAELAATRAHAARLREALEPFAATWAKVPQWMRDAREQRRAVEHLTVDGDSLLLNSADAFECAFSTLAETPAQSLAAITAPLEAKIERLRAALEELRDAVCFPGYRIWIHQNGDMETCRSTPTENGWAGADKFRLAALYSVLDETPAQSLEAVRAKAGRADSAKAENDEQDRWIEACENRERDSTNQERLVKLACEKAGRERTVTEMDDLLNEADKYGHTIELCLTAEPMDFRTRKELVLLAKIIRKRRNEIAKEGK